MAHIAGVDMKTGKGKTGVEFRFYTDREYKRLTEDQKSPRTYHYQTRRATRRTRGECKRYKTSTRNRTCMTSSPFVWAARDPLEGTFRSSATVKSAMVRGP